MRVTHGSQYGSLSKALMAAAVRANQAQEQMATGKKVTRASDAPAEASQLLRLDSQLAAGDTYKRSITDAKAWLASIDDAMQGMHAAMTRADDLALAAMNGSKSPEERQALSQEIRDLRDQIAQEANATHLGQALFAGHSTSAITVVGATPLTKTYSFTGTVGSVTRQIDDNTTVDASYDGAELLGFNAGANLDVFTVLSDLANAVDAGNVASMATARADLQNREADVLTGLETIGSRTLLVERLETRLDDNMVQVQKVRQGIGDIDLAKAYLDVQSTSTAYQAALQAIAKANLPSLADYL